MILEFILLALLAYTPWHGTRYLFSAESPSINISLFNGVDIGAIGAMNAAVSLGTGLLCLLLIFKHSKWKKIDLLLLLPLLSVFLRIVYWDKYSLVSLINTLAITAGLFWISAITNNGALWGKLCKRGRTVFLCSCSISLFVPLLLFLSGFESSAFDSDSAGFHRYRAGFNQPLAVSLLSFVAFCWSFTFFRSEKRWHFGIGVLLSIAFFVTAFLATHRAALLAIFIFLVAQSLANWKSLRIRYIAFGLLLFPISGQFIGAIGEKNSIVTMARQYVSEEVKIETPSNHSSGRFALYPFLFRQAAQQPVFGLGTGSASRMLSNYNYRPFFGADPQSEILRIFLDQGAMGLACVLTVLIIFLLKGYPVNSGLPLALAFLPIFSFESPLVHPNWFYVPFMWILASEALHVREV